MAIDVRAPISLACLFLGPFLARRSQLPLVSAAARSRAQVRTLSALRPLPDVAKRSMGLSVYDYGNDMGSTMDA